MLCDGSAAAVNKVTLERCWWSRGPWSCTVINIPEERWASAMKGCHVKHSGDKMETQMSLSLKPWMREHLL